MCQREAVQRLPAQQIADFSSRAMEFTKTGEVFMFPPSLKWLPTNSYYCVTKFFMWRLALKSVILSGATPGIPGHLEDFVLKKEHWSYTYTVVFETFFLWFACSFKVALYTILQRFEYHIFPLVNVYHIALGRR